VKFREPSAVKLAPVGEDDISDDAAVVIDVDLMDRDLAVCQLTGELPRSRAERLVGLRAVNPVQADALGTLA
jgi:hypothetical protein